MAESAAMTVLVVEDDEDTRGNLRDILALDGYRVDAVGTMREALAGRNWAEVAVVILDRRLPDGSAEELLPRLKRLAPEADVIVATGFADLDGAIAALRNGAVDYIVKPISPAALRTRMGLSAERRRLTQAKLRSETAFRTLVEAAPSIIVILRIDGAILYLNPFTEELTGFSIDEVRGRDFTTVFVEEPARQRLIQRMIDASSRAKAPRGVQGAMACKNGMRRTIVWNAAVLDDFDGQAAVLAIGHDITELNDAQRKALQAERLAAIGEMMAGLTHESRNALQRSKACLEMLALEVEDRPEALDLVRRIEDAQEHLYRLYEEVRGYAAPINLTRDLCDLQRLWREIWSHLVQPSQEKPVELLEQVEGDDFSCRVDRFAIGQVFRNILENALSATPGGDRIIVRCGAARLEGRMALRIAFRDHGPGMALEQRQRIFEPFYTTKTRGTGLGMAIAKRIVQSHGGLIEVSDHSGPGAEMIVILPRELE